MKVSGSSFFSCNVVQKLGAMEITVLNYENFVHSLQVGNVNLFFHIPLVGTDFVFSDSFVIMNSLSFIDAYC